MDEIEARFATTPVRAALMMSLREAVRQIERLGWAKRVFVVGCFIGPREPPNDVDVFVTVDPGAALEERSRMEFSGQILALEKALKPEVDLTPMDDDLPAVAGMIEFFQHDKREHGGFDRGIIELVTG